MGERRAKAAAAFSRELRPFWQPWACDCHREWGPDGRALTPPRATINRNPLAVRGSDEIRLALSYIQGVDPHMLKSDGIRRLMPLRGNAI
jgi:hypothetical protein